PATGSDCSYNTVNSPRRAQRRRNHQPDNQGSQYGQIPQNRCSTRGGNGRRTTNRGRGSALMGLGAAQGENRAVEATEAAIASPLLEASIDGAHGVLLSIQGGTDMGLFEINEAARMVQEVAHPEANIIFGAVISDNLGDEVRVTVIAAGFD